MKANEAPYKIKIGKYNITSDGDVVFGWVTNEPDCEAMQHDIEYVRTDAFIEKAILYLIYNTNVVHYSFGDIREFKNNNFDEVIKDFKNYMKGE